MQITKITVHYGRTQSLPDYCNVKPGFSFEATIEPGDDPEAVRAFLSDQAKAATFEECDRALEANGIPAKFSEAPRYDALRLSDEKYVAVVPAGMKLPEAWKKVSAPKRGWRLEALLKHLTKEWPGYTVQDCGLFDVLPDLAQFQLLLRKREEGCHYCIALPYDFEANDLGKEYRYLRRYYYTVLAENVDSFIAEFAGKNEAELINCLDGDLSKLPKLEAPEPEIEPDMEEPIDDDDDDGWEDDDEREEVSF